MQEEFDTPPVRSIPVGDQLTVAELRALYTGTPKRFGGDSSVYAVVTADEQSGNLYKNVYVQDRTGAIIIRLLNSGGLYQGMVFASTSQNSGPLVPYRGMLP